MMFELLGLVMLLRTNRNFQADDIYLWVREYYSKEGTKKVQKTANMQDRLSLSFLADGSSENKTLGETN